VAGRHWPRFGCPIGRGVPWSFTFQAGLGESGHASLRRFGSSGVAGLVSWGAGVNRYMQSVIPELFYSHTCAGVRKFPGDRLSLFPSHAPFDRLRCIVQ